MFASQQVRKLQQHAKRPPMTESHYKGSNRRAIALMPGPVLRQTQEIQMGSQCKSRELLLSIEASQSTCCLRVNSPKHKSRSAILVFRGRVLACIYGSKQFGEQIFGQPGYDHILADMTHRDNILDAYILSEDLVLAAASMFHGEVFHAREDVTADEIFEAAYSGLVQKAKPGCIVINDQEDLPVAIVYLFSGKIVGVYSHKDGWVSANYEAAAKYLAKARGGKVFAAMLSANSVQEVEQLTFSLSGLGDRESANWTGISRFELGSPIFVNINPKSKPSFAAFESNKFVPGTVNPAAHFCRDMTVGSVFRVQP